VLLISVDNKTGATCVSGNYGRTIAIRSARPFRPVREAGENPLQKGRFNAQPVAAGTYANDNAAVGTGFDYRFVGERLVPTDEINTFVETPYRSNVNARVCGAMAFVVHTEHVEQRSQSFEKNNFFIFPKTFVV